MNATIPAEVIAELLAHARSEAPNECCGLLLGRRGVISSSFRARNLEASTTRYLIDPEDHFAAMRAARERGLRVVGAYHSHPASPPAPSPSDIAEASGGADFLYVIVSLLDETLQAFCVRNGALVVVSLNLEGTTE